SLSSQLIPNDDEVRWDVFLWSPTGNIIRVSQTPSGDGGNMSSYIPALSADGRYTVFRSHAMNLISGDTNYVADILLYDRLIATLERVNLTENGDQAMGGPSDEPAISADGRFVVFRSRATNLVSNDTTTDEDIFIRDRQGGTTLASVSTDSIKANLGSFSPAVSADGQIFAFYSDGFNLDLLRSDDNGVGDIFARGEPPAPPATETPTATPSETPTETPTDTPTIEPTPTDTPEPTPTDTVEPTPTDSPEPSPTATVKPTDTATPKPSATTPDPTATFTPVPTADPTVEPTVVPTDPPTATSEPDPTETAEPTITSDPPGDGQPPVVQLDSSYTLKEGGQLSMSGSFSDPDSDSWTGTVDYGDGSGLQPLTLKNNGGFKLNWTFGDDGEYTVVVNITDESGRTGSAEVQVKVKNQTPSAQAEKSINLAECEQAEKSGKKDKPDKACKIGDWYIATAGQPTDFVIEMNDAGSDDLHIVWDSSSDTVYYNAGSSPDPYPSPWGTYPFSVRHNATVVFDKPGVRYIKVQVSDDDGGTTTIWLKVLVRNKEKCRTSLGYWIQRFMREGDGVYKGELRAHLSVLSAFVTSSFGEFRPDMIDRLESFVLDNTGQSARARAQLITAWLNFTNGSVDWDEWIQKADGKHDMTYADVLREMLTILMKSGSDEDFERVIELAESINLGHHSGGTGCPVYSE
ncbi:MAG: PKD domain-containing protein, partial [Anaerolineales bacterium]